MIKQLNFLKKFVVVHGSLAFVLWLCASASASSVIDAPHNDTNGMTCTSCHTYSLWWEYSPAKTSQSPTFSTIVNTVCMKCHESGDKIPVKTHSSAEFGSANLYHGGWGVGCTDCHDPHFQRQLDWGTEAFLIEGKVNYGIAITPSTENIGGVVYDRSTITILSLTKEDNVNWPSSKWTKKTLTQDPNVEDRGLILTQDTSAQLSTFSIVSVTTNATTNKVETITVNGKLSKPATSSTFDTFGLSYGQLIKKSVAVPYSAPIETRQVKFVTPIGGFVDLVNPPSSAMGICQVCHTLTKDSGNLDPATSARFINNGAALTGSTDWHAAFPADTVTGKSTCTTCHTHGKGFKGEGHTSSDFGWTSISYNKANGGVETVDCAACHNPSHDPNISIIGVVHGNKCVLCHVSSSGGKALRVAGSSGADKVDPTNGIDGDPSGATRTATCVTCHDKASKGNIENTIPLIHHATPGNFAATGDCVHCHAGHVSDFGWASISYTKADNRTETVNCATCHNPDQVANISIVGVIHGNKCVLCHVANAGQVTLRVAGSTGADQVDPTNGIDGDPNGATKTATCATCHDKSSRPNILTLPLIHHATPNNYFASNDCTHCHAGHVNDFGWASISFTKANGIEETVDCAACHDSSKSIVSVIHGNKCELCHFTNAGNVSLRVAGSLGDNKVDPANGIDADPSGATRSATCATCHDKALKSNIESLPLIHHVSPGNYFASNDCAHCHAGHANDFGWASVNYTKADNSVESVNCATCHDDSKSIIGVIHGNKCELCHFTTAGSVSLRVAGSAGDNKVDPTNGIDGDPSGATKAATCATCHEKSATRPNIANTLSLMHHTTPGKYAAEGHCTQCHKSASMGNTSFTRAADHSSVLVTAVTTVTDGKIKSGCLECHKPDPSTNTDYSTDGNGFGARIDAGVDNPRVHDTCTSCHKVDGSLKMRMDLDSDRRTLMVSGYAPGHGPTKIPDLDQPITTCFGCHGPDAGLNHSQHDHSDMVGNTPACNWCHYKQVGLTNGATVDPNDPMVHAACTTCHAISKGILGDFRIGLIDPDTLNHSPRLVSVMETPELKYAAQGIAEVICTDCHAVHLFKDHIAADHTKVVKTSTEGCTNSCHIDTDGNPGPGFGMNVSDSNNMIHDACTSCHNTITGRLHTVEEVNKPYVIAMPDPTEPNKPNNPKDGGGECSACHGVNYFLRHTHTHTVALNTTVDPKDLANADPTKPCSNCHQTNGWAQILDAHGNSCNTCHNATRLTGLDSTQTVADVIAAKPDTQTNCLTCHWDKEIQNDHGHLFGWSGNCVDCHGPNTLAVMELHKSSDCTLCHISPGTGNYDRRAGTKGSAIGATGSSTCTDCHSSTTYPTGAFHHLTTKAAEGACVDCHKVINGANHSGDHTNLVAGNGPCSCTISCHTATAGNAYGVPLSPGADKVHDACTTCHTNSGPLKASYTNARGKLILMPGNAVPPSNDGGGYCCNCHGFYYFNEHAHHSQTASVQANTLLTPVTKNCTTSGCHLASNSPFIGGGQPHGDCYTCHNFDTGALKGSAAGHQSGGECSTCHNDHIEFTGHREHTATTHAVLRRDSDLSNGSLCDTCHGIGGMSTKQFGNTWGGATGIYTLHKGACTTCHDSTRTINVKAGYASVQAIIQDDNLAIGCLDCHADRADFHGGHKPTDFVTDSKCSGCHTGTDIIATTHKNLCGLCHINPQGGGTRRAGTDGNAILGTTVTDSCLVCHNPATYPTGAIHHNTVNATTYNCTFCHEAGTLKGGDHSTKVSTSSKCDSCHMPLVTVGTATGIPVNPNDNRVHDGCSTCHNTNGALKAPYGKAINMPPGGGSCTSCHGDYFLNHDNVGNHNSFLTKATTSCLTCHDQAGGADIVATIHNATILNGNCSKCHDPITHAMINGTTFAKKVNGVRYMIGDASKHTYGGTSSCAVCHQYNAYMSDTLSNHPSGNWSHPDNVGDEIFCSGCHLALSSPFIGADMEGNLEVHGKGNTCGTCHGANYVLKGSALNHIVGSPSSCSTCHNGTKYLEINTITGHHVVP